MSKYSSTELWNPSGIPAGFHFTFRTYGTWLHGDDRGCVDRFRNKHGTPFKPANRPWKKYKQSLMKRDPVTLNRAQRLAVSDAIKETCEKRRWSLVEKNVRTNHVHAVVRIGESSPETALNAFKANATRIMRERGIWTSPASPWAERGSKRPLWNEIDIAQAAAYVQYQQGPPLDSC